MVRKPHLQLAHFLQCQRIFDLLDTYGDLLQTMPDLATLPCHPPLAINTINASEHCTHWNAANRNSAIW
jgi:hypothetical protein